ncbi:MAG: AMP-binding protein, partial [Selenomonadaceae bacterium]|nr:AMP-binding protein [Selenomonadaceae bacterium]
MKTFIEQIERNSLTFANRLAVALDCKDEVLTYGELWNLAGKVYSYLKSHNIGKEDFVLIKLPRSPKIIVALIGIWRAGAAGTITENGYPAERVNYIKKDCNAKIVIDEKIYNEILNCESLNGFEKTDPHDACFAVYTSGTTGNPKGALHEYGKLELCVNAANVHINSEICNCAVNIPLNFVAFLLLAVPNLYAGFTTYIVSYELVKNISKLKDFFERDEITETFMTPSILKIYTRDTIPVSIKRFFVGGELVSNLYLDGVKLINRYSTSETAFLIAEFCIDKAYNKTPVGKNNFGLEILILNEAGQKLPNGEQGEICIENKFFRGYINLPEQTEKVFRGGIFHTGDLGYKDDDGNLIISGRADDMIKINGNRVEPGEIEIIAKEILGVNNIIAKGFVSEGTAFVTLYGLTDEIGDKFNAENIPVLREKLSKHLPEYMIPTYYLTLEKFPLNAYGKVSRKLFPAPNVKPQQIEYLPPVTETEKIICQKMAENLNVKKKFSPAQVKEKIFPAINDAYQNYLQTGTIRSMYSSFFAADEDAIKKISHSLCVEITLREKINSAQLQAAVDKAVEICPYATFDISKRDGIVYFHKNNLPLVVHKAGTLENFGTAENNRHYVAISYENSKIIFNISHILTDGFGTACFIQAVIDFYFGKEKAFYEGADKVDFVADLMAQELPLPADYVPKSYAVENHFVPPEINSLDNGKTYENFIEMPTKKFRAFCKKYRVSAQIGISILLARAVQMAHPDNDKIISVRGPVNTRTPLHVPNTFQNASIPHIFLNFEPHYLNSNLTAKDLENIKKDFSDQYSYENLAAATNWTKKFFSIKNPAERAEMAKVYKKQTDIFTSYMGNSFAEDVAEHVESLRQK